MKRYQVYLDPNAVLLLDETQLYTKIHRSKIIRDAVESVADNIAKILASVRTPSPKKYFFDDLEGFIRLKTSQKVSYARRPDKYYLED